MTDPVLLATDARGVATVTLNRPDIHNAFDDELIRRLKDVFLQLGRDPAVHVVVLAAAGPSFSAGADLNWMRRMAGNAEAENFADAMELGRMLEALDRCPKPVVAAVQGAALGGGVGLCAAADIVVASDRAVFGLTEVRLGIIPAVISPYVVPAIGPRACRRYFLTGERFDAAEAYRLGLVQQVVAPAALAAAVEGMVDELLKCGPDAQAAAKDLIQVVRSSQPGEDLIRYTARRIAELRASAEGREGLSAFLEKRKPGWMN